MLREMATALNNLQAAVDIGKAIASLRDTATIQTKVIEFQSAIISAQTSAIAANTVHTGLIERIRDLEAEVARLRGWEPEKQVYELTRLPGGITAYTLTPNAEPTEPTYSGCASEYETVSPFETRASARLGRLHTAAPRVTVPVPIVAVTMRARFVSFATQLFSLRLRR